MWAYAGLHAPKSIIIPHILKVRLPHGPINRNFFPLTRLRRHHQGLDTSSFFDLPDSKKRELIKIFSKNLASQLKKNRIRFVRCWFPWNVFQPRIYPGKEQAYRFPLDDFVRILNEDRIEIIAVIGNGYHRFLPEGLDIDRSAVYLSRLSESSREIVRHYKGQISVWQLENEPNWWLMHFASDWRRGGIWFDRNLSDLVLGELHKIVREEDPNTPTMINLEADPPGAFSKLYDNYCDLLGLDFYPNYAHPTPIRVSEIRKVSEAKRLSGKPIMITETGYPSGPRIFGYNAENQTQFVKSMCEEAYSNDDINGLGMWRLSDGHWLSFPFQENHFGLVNHRGIPKPAWFEYLDQSKNKS